MITTQTIFFCPEKLIEEPKTELFSFDFTKGTKMDLDCLSVKLI